MTLTLYPDQQETLAELRRSMSRNKSVLLQAATGFGKTKVAQYMVQATHQRGNGIIFTVPRKQLLEQTSDTFNEGGINHSYIAAGKSFNPYSRCHIGMIDTMARRLDKLPAAKLVIVDEAHYGEEALTSVINHYKERGSWIIGLSATPWKLSGKGLGCYYDDMVSGASIRWLMDNKRLSDYRYFHGRTPLDFEKARISGGEYNKSDVDGIIEANEAAIIGDAVSDYRDKAMGLRHIIRCVSIKRSEIMAQTFRDNGINAVHVDGKTEKNELRQIMRAFARREILVLTFCDLLNFGFDLAQAAGMDACVESGDDQKPSKSLAGQMQFWGRMLRMKPEQALIFDRVNNWKEHGFPCDEREWTLEDRVQGKKSGNRTVSTRHCAKCLSDHPPRPTCPNCGHVHEIKGREIDDIDGEMIELSRSERDELRNAEILERKREQGRAQTFEDLIKVGKARGMRNPVGWAAKVMAARRAKRG